MVLLPLLFNSFLILILNNSLSRAESLIASSRRQMTVVHKLTHAIYVETEILLGGNNAMMNGSYRFFSPLLNQGWAMVENDLAVISQNLTAEASYIKFQNDINNLLERQQAIFIKSESPSMRLDNILVKLRRINEWVLIGGKLTRLLHRLQEEVREKYLQSVRLQQEEQKLVGEIVIVAIISNTLLALLLIRLFQRDFSARINALSEMAKKLPFNEPINETISGSDELQEIGVELAKVSWKLADVAEYRQSLMQMMAHDVRSPLMAAEISIATLDKFMKKSLSLKSSEKLTDASRALANCLTLVNDLLLLESLENGETKPVFETCDIDEIISSAIENQALRSKVDTVNSCDGIVLKVDRKQISLVFQRMISSADGRSPDGGALEITCEAVNNRLRLKVRDYGNPLLEQDSAGLFDKACQASRVGDDAIDSLGLSIAVPILNLHGGSIEAKALTDGNLLSLDLPLLKEPPYGAQEKRT